LAKNFPKFKGDLLDLGNHRREFISKTKGTQSYLKGTLGQGVGISRESRELLGNIGTPGILGDPFLG